MPKKLKQAELQYTLKVLISRNYIDKEANLTSVIGF